MLNFFTIFSKGGFVLWLFKLSQEDHINPINYLIRDIIMDGKLIEKYTFNRLTMEFKENRDLNLIYVAGYSTILNLDYTKQLLAAIDTLFSSIYKPLTFDYSSFTDTFTRELNRIEGLQKPAIISDPVTETKNHDPILTEDINSNIKNQSCVINQKQKDNESKKSVKNTVKNKPSKSKQARFWEGTYDERNADKLDFSDSPLDTKNTTKRTIKRELPGNKNLQTLNSQTNNSNTEYKFYSFFKSLVSGKVISNENLDPIMQKIKMHLYSKNVAVDIADQICASVMTNLIGQTVSTFSGISYFVQKALEDTLTHILTPKRDINILNSIANNTSNLPFVIVFCGVNGVGKSTNLAKIAYHLLNNGLRILIAACDTFRSGAVEQLKTHVSRFNDTFSTSPPSCALFERGYGKDAAAVASEAIRTGKSEKYDVVMIDTAGRMQNNEPLMRSLAKLVKVNNPDLILFVGEALVGNDGVDQLKEFDRHLVEFSNSENPRRIDGIVLTKFDAIDDKVGAALSMTYATGQPIVFVGVGQTYNDLRVLDVKSVVSLLLK